jgi:hypothetical protein
MVHGERLGEILSRQTMIEGGGAAPGAHPLFPFWGIVHVTAEFFPDLATIRVNRRPQR